MSIKTYNGPGKIKEPKNLEIKSPDEIFWTEIRAKCEAEIQTAKRQIVISTHVIQLADDMVKTEKDKHLNKPEPKE